MLSVLKGVEDEARDEHGRWTSGGSDNTTPDLAHRVLARLNAEAEEDGRKELEINYEKLAQGQNLNLSRFVHENEAVLSKSESDALKEYTGLAYRETNKLLREAQGKPCGLCPDLDSAIAKGVIPSDIETFRGADLPESVINQLEPGAVITDRGYVSTTISARRDTGFTMARAGEPVVFNIKLPKGSQGLAVGNHGVYSEYEVLLPRKSRFQVETVAKLRENGYDRTVISMKYLGTA